MRKHDTEILDCSTFEIERCVRCGATHEALQLPCPDEVYRCWSCGEKVTQATYGLADGFCPHCGAEKNDELL